MGAALDRDEDLSAEAVNAGAIFSYYSWSDWVAWGVDGAGSRGFREKERTASGSIVKNKSLGNVAEIYLPNRTHSERGSRVRNAFNDGNIPLPLSDTEPWLSRSFGRDELGFSLGLFTPSQCVSNGGSIIDGNGQVQLIHPGYQVIESGVKKPKPKAR